MQRKRWRHALRLVLTSILKTFVLLFLFQFFLLEYRIHYGMETSIPLGRALLESCVGVPIRVWEIGAKLVSLDMSSHGPLVDLMLGTRNTALLLSTVLALAYLAFIGYVVFSLRRIRPRMGRRSGILLYLVPVTFAASELRMLNTPSWLFPAGSLQWHSYVSSQVLGRECLVGVLPWLFVILLLAAVLLLGDGQLGGILGIARKKVREYQDSSYYKYDRARGLNVFNIIRRDLTLEYFRSVFVRMPMLFSIEILMEMVFDIRGLGYSVLESLSRLQIESAEMMTKESYYPLFAGLMVISVIVVLGDLVGKAVELWIDPRVTGDQLEQL